MVLPASWLIQSLFHYFELNYLAQIKLWQKVIICFDILLFDTLKLLLMIQEITQNLLSSLGTD
jgi:hypothetical protein